MIHMNGRSGREVEALALNPSIRRFESCERRRFFCTFLRRLVLQRKNAPVFQTRCCDL
jgi:hypothetical protein